MPVQLGNSQQFTLDRGIIVITENLKMKLHRELRQAGFKPVSVKAICWTRINNSSFSVILSPNEWTFDNETAEDGFFSGDYSAEGVEMLCKQIRSTIFADVEFAPEYKG